MSLVPNEGQKSMFPMIEELRKKVERLQKENAELQQQLKNCNLQSVSQQRELLRAYHNYLLQNTDKHECLHTIDEFLKARNCG